MLTFFIKIVIIIKRWFSRSIAPESSTAIISTEGRLNEDDATSNTVTQ